MEPGIWLDKETECPEAHCLQHVQSAELQSSKTLPSFESCPSITPLFGIGDSGSGSEGGRDQECSNSQARPIMAASTAAPPDRWAPRVCDRPAEATWTPRGLPNSRHNPLPSDIVATPCHLRQTLLDERLRFDCRIDCLRALQQLINSQPNTPYAHGRRTSPAKTVASGRIGPRCLDQGTRLLQHIHVGF